MSKRIEAIVYGYVQGVYFRYYTRREAMNLGLTGWVANRFDGTVEVIAEGPENKLKQLVTFLHRGSPKARVDKVKVAWLEASENFSDFDIQRL